MDCKRLLTVAACATLGCFHVSAQHGMKSLPESTVEQKAMYATSTADLEEWMTYFTSEECRGRLTGDVGFFKAVNYAADLFKEWGLEPGGDDNTYYQNFPHPYTEVFEGGHFTLYMPQGDEWVGKQYDYPNNYMVGGTSDTGFLQGKELVYVGYGITAPELGYDSYAGVDVKDKIVVCDRDVPYHGKDKKLLKAWMPYQEHTHKMSNAAKHGVAGLIYISIAGNPNPGFNKGFVYACVSDSVANDIFAGTGKDYAEVKANLDKTLKPNSFPIHKKADIKAISKDHPDGKGCNVIGVLRGTDPKLAPQYLTIGGHIDHIGMQPYMCPGATDNASGSVIVMGAAKALATSGYKPKRTIVFVLFGGEETGLYGSDYLANHPIMPNEDCQAVINIDCLSYGYGLGCSVAEKYNGIFDYLKEANETNVGRPIVTVEGANEIVTRPRSDAANFFLKGIPAISLFAYGAEVKAPYHNPGDTMEYVDFDIVRDAVKWMTKSLMIMSEVDEVKTK